LPRLGVIVVRPHERMHAQMRSEARVVAVVVTWNRRDLLRLALGALRTQTRPVDEIVVIDNASSDGTAEMVRSDFESVHLVTLGHNTGGAGGFAAGLDHALAEHKPDLLWLMDDDTVPEPTALEQLLATADRYPGRKRPVLLASRVVWSDGRDHPMNTPRRKPWVRRSEARRAEEAGAMPIRSASFVSILVDAETVRDRGLPIADYFLWNDDFEFTTRMLRRRIGLLCPASVVVHKTKTFGAADADPGPRFFYEVRNKVWTFTRSRGMNPLEKATYGAGTARRWLRTFVASRDRRALAREFRRGMRAGLGSRPRPNAEALAGASDHEEGDA
jgi:rhamnopyranosyl-N-acetylglucosaminyl-diphospho-decaprenol beta-1,3/1,4-galactofuranosyltransferase